MNTHRDPLRVAVLTSHDIRHRYFARTLARRFNVVAVGYQDTEYQPGDPQQWTLDAATEELLRYHFEERTRVEERYFGHDAKLITEGETLGGGSNVSVQRLTVRTLNTIDTLNWLQSAGVNSVAVFGTSLIKSPLLEAYAGRMINMHLGLSPYYRGTATNFYPLVNGEPEYVGATIHLIDAGIDTGPILHHARPKISPDDMPHTLGCKAILAGIEKVIQSIEELRDGQLKPIPQWPVPNAKVYFRKDYHPTQVATLYQKIQRGLFTNPTARSCATQLQLVE